MKSNIALKIRLYPNKTQQKLINKNFGCTRYIYNQLLDMYHKTGKVVSYKEVYNSDNTWLMESDTASYANARLNLMKAIKNHFKNPNKFGMPIFKGKHNKKQSYTTSVTNNNSRIVDNKHIRLPKVGVIKAKIHRNFDNSYKLKSVTVERDVDNKYYASLLYEYQKELVENQTNKVYTSIIGIDYSMENLGVLSNGTNLMYSKYYKKNLEKIKILSRKLSSCTPYSNNWYKRKSDLARLLVKIKNQRLDYMNKTAKSLSEKYDIIAIEDLNLQEMSKDNHYGKSIYDNAYNLLIRKLEYKLSILGKELIKVGKFYPSSKRCSKCGHIKKDLKLSDRTYSCTCGNIIHRDVNAAINIEEEGMKLFFQKEMDKQIAMFAI